MMRLNHQGIYAIKLFTFSQPSLMFAVKAGAFQVLNSRVGSSRTQCHKTFLLMLQANEMLALPSQAFPALSNVCGKKVLHSRVGSSRTQYHNTFLLTLQANKMLALPSQAFPTLSNVCGKAVPFRCSTLGLAHQGPNAMKLFY
jgi:hypothetical protein